ncbi:glycosyltransferase family 39 protein [Acetivibrio clariflavus]|uniref:Glycosyltransferase RgtA/B/C/D-like domain-containing protein n=1 Tax=Acetivibrio clariflavus (strain DSM 19732 / NBRC 101661 / EBR45) TaxID=720554 RepID=G8LZF4_ACECE|nr:glycosyltransferase family 39 protein [Acetivibrio clariflavus]AEV66817.1 hypothetical protein Clocl_0060 [Acetivibrio clariflavus DSM 19732]
MFTNRIKNIFSTAVLLMFTVFILFNTLFFIAAKPLKIYFRTHATISTLFFTAGAFICAGIIIFLYNKYNDKIKLDRQIPVMLALIFITAVPRFIWIACIKVTPLSDFNTYHIIATAFAKGNVIGGSYISLFPHYIGYPAFLAPFYRIFGASATVATVLNVVLSCIISLLTYSIGSSLFDKKCGFIGALIWAFWPSQIFYTALVSTETTFTFLMLLCIYFFISILKNKDKKGFFSTSLKFFLLGVLCSVSNIIRPVGQIVLIAICLYYLVFVIEKIRIKNNILPKIIFLAFILTGYLITSTLISFATSKAIGREIAKYPIGFNIYVGSNYESNGSWNAEDANTLTEIQKTPGITAQEIHNELLKRSWERIRNRSLFKNFIFICKKHGMIWPVDHDSLVYIRQGLIQEDMKFDFYKFERLLVKLSNFYYHTILLLCAFGGIILILKKNQEIPLFLVIIILSIVFLHFIVEVAGRYHFPTISIFSILASYGMSSLNDFNNINTIISRKGK